MRIEICMSLERSSVTFYQAVQARLRKSDPKGPRSGCAMGVVKAGVGRRAGA